MSPTDRIRAWLDALARRLADHHIETRDHTTAGDPR